MPRPNSERIQLSLGVTPQERPGPHVSYTMELIELINWQPNPTKGPKGEAIITNRLAGRRWPRGMSKSSWGLPWPEDAGLETRMAYGRALMDGYDLWLTVLFFEPCTESDFG